MAGTQAAVDGVYQHCCAEGQLGRTESLNDQRQKLQLVDLSHGMPQDKARLALSAEPVRVVRMILSQSIVVIAIGVVAGVPLALIAARALAAQLYGVAPWHPAPFAVAALVLLAAGLLASILPSRTASRFDPLIAIRSD